VYKWIKVYGVPKPECHAQATQAEELRRLKAELKWVT
jgi:transposase